MAEVCPTVTKPQADSAPHTWQSGGSSPTAQATGAQARSQPFGGDPFRRERVPALVPDY